MPLPRQNCVFHFLAPISLFKHMSIWAICSHSIMKITFIPISKVLIVSNNLSNVKSLNLKSLQISVQPLNCNPQSKTRKQLLSKLPIPVPFCSYLAIFLRRYTMPLASEKSWSPQSSYNVTAPCFKIWDPHMLFWAPPNAGITSPPLPSVAL